MCIRDRCSLLRGEISQRLGKIRLGLCQFGRFCGKLAVERLQFCAALCFQIRLRLLRGGEELIDGGHLLFRGGFLGQESGSRGFTLLVLLVGLCVQGQQALLRGAQVLLGFRDEGSGGFELALGVCLLYTSRCV